MAVDTRFCRLPGWYVDGDVLLRELGADIQRGRCREWHVPRFHDCRGGDGCIQAWSLLLVGTRDEVDATANSIRPTMAQRADELAPARISPTEKAAA